MIGKIVKTIAWGCVQWLALGMACRAHSREKAPIRDSSP